MKQNFTKILGTGAIALAMFIRAIAQSPPQPASPPMAPPPLPSGTDANSPLGHIIRMLQSGTAENVIFGYISTSAAPFNISPADMVFLNDLGTPSEIQTAMTRRDQELGVNSSVQAQPQPSPPDQNPQPQDITADYFYGALAPYGTWVNISGYGLCWQPCAATYDASWAPYCTLGQWFYTDCGWYWLSNYSWGWCVFHYGRWFHDVQHGWCWWPATKWAPSWVFWRYSGTDCGWAPLPPHSYYSQGNGLVYNGAPVPSSYDFGIGANLFNFVPMANLCSGNTERYRLPAAQSAQIFAESQVLNAINSNDRTIVNDGIPVHKIAAANHRNIPFFKIQPMESVALPGARGEQILPGGETLAVNRPYFNADGPSALRQGIYPVPTQEQPVPHQLPTFIVNENPLIQPPVNNDNNSVIYVDRAAQNAPPPAGGPQDISAGAPCPVPSGGSYWSVSAEAAVPIENDSEYMSPRLRSHERSQHHVQQRPDHREPGSTSATPHPEQQQSHQDHPPEHPAATPRAESAPLISPNAPPPPPPVPAHEHSH